MFLSQHPTTRVAGGARHAITDPIRCVRRTVGGTISRRAEARLGGFFSPPSTHKADYVLLWPTAFMEVRYVRYVVYVRRGLSPSCIWIESTPACAQAPNAIDALKQKQTVVINLSGMPWYAHTQPLGGQRLGCSLLEPPANTRSAAAHASAPLRGAYQKHGSISRLTCWQLGDGGDGRLVLRSTTAAPSLSIEFRG